jgi:hypothetical protein
MHVCVMYVYLMVRRCSMHGVIRNRGERKRAVGDPLHRDSWSSHTYIHTYTYTYMYARMQIWRTVTDPLHHGMVATHIHTHIHIHIHIHVWTYADMKGGYRSVASWHSRHTHTYENACMNVCRYEGRLQIRYILTHGRHTHTYTHTYTHTCMNVCRYEGWLQIRYIMAWSSHTYIHTYTYT